MQDNEFQEEEYGNSEYEIDEISQEENPEVLYVKNRGFFRGLMTGIVFSLFAYATFMLVGYFWMDKKNNDEVKQVSGNVYTNLVEDGDGSAIFNAEDFAKMKLIQSYIDTYSYYKQDIKKLKDGVFSAFLSSLDDKYAVYYNQEDYTALNESTEGKYVGIGCVVSQNTSGQVVAIQPYKGSPAYEAGIGVGDIILKADGTELTGMDLSEAVSHIRGEEGTDVEITFLHEDEEITKTIKRLKIEIPTVEYEIKNDNTGYIKISSFDEVTVGQFSKAVDDLIAKGAKGLVFDVRSNPGGLYDSVVAMLDKLLPEGTLVYTEDKYGNRETKTSDADCVKLPMAVLINGNSASASEIFAGAMKDFKAAEIIGTQSFGKGIVQAVVPIGDGSALKLTVSSYFTPSGVCIQDVGITPDEIVELTTDEKAYDENGYLLDEYDTQLQAALKYIEEKTK